MYTTRHPGYEESNLCRMEAREVQCEFHLDETLCVSPGFSPPDATEVHDPVSILDMPPGSKNS